MKSKASIKVGKVPLSRKKVKVNIQKVFEALIKGGIKAAVKYYNNILEKLAGLADLSAKNQPPQSHLRSHSTFDHQENYPFHQRWTIPF